jgi:CelD/BcsL family acetyltransferase involved in cellulose biosynthesis
MKASVVHPADLGSAEQLLWGSFARQSSLESPFLSWPFVESIGHVRDDARVAIFHDGSRICGFLAFQVGTDLPGSDQTGLPIGATICDAQAVVAHPGWTFDPRGLVEAAGLSRWSFDHLTMQQAAFLPYHHRRHRSPVVDLAAGYDAFVDEVRTNSKDLMAQVGRRRRKLEREVGPVVCEWQSIDPDGDLPRLAQWKSEQYAREDTWDRFSVPWIVEALELLARSRDETCTGLLTSVRAGGQLVAAHFGLLGRDRLCWWFPTYNPEFSRYSPGLILLLDVIAEAAKRGVGMVDLGRGEHGYKLRATSRYYEVAEGEVLAGAEAGLGPVTGDVADPGR